jgi:hypothetical protein
MLIARIAAACMSAFLLASSVAAAKGHQTVVVPSGKLISVQLQSDLGSRISNEGDTFAVTTVEDLYVHGRLVLPEGSPGYGVITHVKRSGMFHSGGEFTFELKRLVTPDGMDIHVDMIGSTGDAARETEHNGNSVGRYILFGLGGLFSARGNDMLIKRGALFHVVTEATPGISVVPEGDPPARLNTALISQQ